MRRSGRIPGLVVALVAISGLDAAQNTARKAPPKGGAKEYTDNGVTIVFPLGDRSFADEVVSFQSGNPQASNEADRDPTKALGPPDYDSSADKNYTTLGCGGSLVLRFVDNALTDVPGEDLHVFEIGPDKEPTAIAISEDGKKWIEVGKMEGGTSGLDIHPFVKPGQVFHYVRLTDLKEKCEGEWPGADIDAVGAIGSGLQFSLNSGVLFDTNKFALKPAAKAELDKVVAQIKKWPGASVRIEGHTDSVGTDAANVTLSENRAASVKAYFEGAGLAGFPMETAGYGAGRPVARNDTEEGRAANRRVDVVVVPRS